MTHFCAVRRYVTTLIVGVALMSASAAAEETRTRWYGSLTGLQDMPSAAPAASGNPNIGTIEGGIELSDESGFALAFGLMSRHGQQVELEAAFRSFDIEGLRGLRIDSFPVPPGYSVTGNWHTRSLTVNARQLFSSGPVRPYIGGGIGVVRHEGVIVHSFEPLGLEGDDSGEDTVLAYQFMAGAEFQLSQDIRAFGGYRYMGSADVRIRSLTAGFATHAVEAGFRIRF